MENCSECAKAWFAKGFNCSQSVLAAYAERLDTDLDVALRVSSGFGGGIGRMAGICGAVTGACMVIGLKHGKGSGDSDARKLRTYELVREFAEEFAAKHGSVTCRDLLGVDISTEEGTRLAQERDLHRTRCVGLVEDSAEMVGKYLER